MDMRSFTNQLIKILMSFTTMRTWHELQATLLVAPKHIGLATTGLHAKPQAKITEKSSFLK